MIRIGPIVFALATLMSACQLGTLPAGEPMCVAQDLDDGTQIRCAAPANAYPGDGCTCVNSVSRAAFRGRVEYVP